MTDPMMSQAPQPFNQQIAHSRRMSAGILSIILAVIGLGWIGIPKFMLGFNKAGLITLLVSICTCGAAAVIFNIMTLVEGIIYLTKTDEDFHQLYIAGDKQWF